MTFSGVLYECLKFFVLKSVVLCHLDICWGAKTICLPVLQHTMSFKYRINTLFLNFKGAYSDILTKILIYKVRNFVLLKCDNWNV